MTSQPLRTGVCIIRLEHDGARVLVSLQLNADIRERSGDRQHRCADIDEALQVVRDFVTSFARHPANSHPGTS
jgi:hypothetical protein